jgi:hypothetical protein
MQHRNALKSSRQTSLVDTISQGFHTVNRRIWVLAIPVLLDLYYWLGPRISIAPLFARIRNAYPELWNQATRSLQTEVDVNTLLPDLRYITFRNLLQPLVPTIDTPAPPFTPTAWYVDNVATGTLALVLSNVFVITCVTLYLLPLAHVLNERKRRLSMRRFGQVVVSLLAIVGMLVSTVLFSLLIASIVVSLVALVAEPLALFVMFAYLAFMLWLMFVVSFSFDAVVVSGVGPLRAILISFRVVQRSLFSALSFWLLTLLIIWGMRSIWQGIATSGSSLGLLAAIIGSAYITSGLAAAHLAFYRDRQVDAARKT